MMEYAIQLLMIVHLLPIELLLTKKLSNLSVWLAASSGFSDTFRLKWEEELDAAIPHDI